MIDKDRAVALRKSGMTYAQVAEHMGISKAWCAKNLKEVKRASLEVAPNHEKEKIITALEAVLSVLRGSNA